MTVRSILCITFLILLKTKAQDAHVERRRRNGRKLAYHIDFEMMRDSSQDFEEKIKVIEASLISACTEERNDCCKDVEGTVENNSVHFAKHRHLLDLDHKSRSLQLSNEIEIMLENSVRETANIVVAIMKAVFDILELIIMTPVVMVIEILYIFADTLSTVTGVAVGKDEIEESNVYLASKIVGHTVETLISWSGEDENDDRNMSDVRNEPQKRNLLRKLETVRNDNATAKWNKSETLSKGDKNILPTVLQLGVFGYVVGGGDVLTSAQYSYSAYAYLSPIESEM